uniref:Chemokine interleukin-8-like domain-containing protein n=1 Tax=Oncorhynchus mykiss TaxID=8022 RepID=A0A8C7NHN6_ONCMY
MWGRVPKTVCSILKWKNFGTTKTLPRAGCLVKLNRRPSKVTTNCCTSVSDTPIKSELQGYRIQNSMPPCVNAIIFYTVKGEKICSDPKTPWVDRRKKVTWLLKEQRGPADSKCFIYVMADPLCIIKALKDTQSIQRETDEER